MPDQHKLTILFLAANPVGTAQLQLDEEFHALDAELRKTEFRDRFDLRSSWAVRYGDVQELLLRYKPHIVHFSGHGSNTGEIILQNPDRSQNRVPPDVLAALFATLKKNIRCVVLNACYSQLQAEGVAQSIDCVVGMRRAIPDQAAIEFAAGFYLGLGYGESVATAFDLGCNRIGLASGFVQRHLKSVQAVQDDNANDAIPRLLAPRTDPAEIVLINALATAQPVTQLPIAFDWVLVRAGPFLMGSDQAKDKLAYDSELPQHEVNLPAFRIARVPVTNEQYEQFVDATGHATPEHWTHGRIPAGQEQHPVGNVTWDDAQAFCKWAGVRLPAEAEWEKAARGTDGRLYPWGNEPPTAERCNVNSGPTTPVGSYPKGASPYGVLDMAGNVWEWTATKWADNYHNYQPDDRPEGDALCVVRGGAFDDALQDARCAARYGLYPNNDSGDFGFRVVLSPSGS